MEDTAVYRSAIRQGISEMDSAMLTDINLCIRVVQERLRRMGIQREPTPEEIVRVMQTL